MRIVIVGAAMQASGYAAPLMTGRRAAFAVAEAGDYRDYGN
jgi:hypothetical protein